MESATLLWMKEEVQRLIQRIMEEDKSAYDSYDTSSSAYNRLSESDIQEILLMLLEQATDIETLIKLLKVIYAKENDANQEEEKKDDIINQNLEVQFNTQSLQGIVNKFLSVYLRQDLENIIEFLKTVQNFNREPYEILFTQSEAKNYIAQNLG